MLIKKLLCKSIIDDERLMRLKRPFPFAYCVLLYLKPAYCVWPYFDLAYCKPLYDKKNNAVVVFTSIKILSKF